MQHACNCSYLVESNTKLTHASKQKYIWTERVQVQGKNITGHRLMTCKLENLENVLLTMWHFSSYE